MLCAKLRLNPAFETHAVVHRGDNAMELVPKDGDSIQLSASGMKACSTLKCCQEGETVTVPFTGRALSIWHRGLSKPTPSSFELVEVIEVRCVAALILLQGT